MKRRDFPIIRLAPWEHLPSATPNQIEERAQNVVPFEWRGQQLQLAARLADIGDGRHFIFARFVGSDDEANWVLGLGRHYDYPQQFNRGTQLKLAKRLQSKKRSRYFPFGRLFYFEKGQLGSQRAYCAYVGANGSAQWVRAGIAITGHEEESFRLPLESDSLLDIPALELREHLLSQVGRQDSDASFALRWHEIESRERENLIYEVKRGSLDELRRVLLRALQIELRAVDQEGFWSWSIQDANHSSYINHWATDGRWDGEQSVSVRLRTWQQLAFDSFAPSVRESVLERHICARYWLGNSLSLLSLIEVATQTPTYHERMEAALFLREWARDKVSPRKLQLLLSRV